MSEESRAKSAVVLTSGGVESFVLLNDALGRYENVTPLYIQNHLRWENAELYWLKKFLRNLRSPKLNPLETLEITMKDLYEKHWSVTGVKVPGGDSPDEAVYLPGRNIIFLSKAAVFSALRNIPVIEIGVLSGNPFSDSSKSFFGKLSGLFTEGLGKPVSIQAPFQKLKKSDVIQRGKKLPLEQSFSCINPKGYDHCGDCNKCVERKKAFFAVGLPDKTSYRKSGF